MEEKLLEPYGFRSGWASCGPQNSSQKYPGHTYSAWELILNSKLLNVGEMSVDEASARLRPDFESRAKLLYESCLKQLSMSEIYSFNSESATDLFVYIYYPPEISLENGMSFDEALKKLDEAFYITATLRKSSFINSYSIRYMVHGVQYDN